MSLGRHASPRTLFVIVLLALLMSSALQMAAGHYPRFHPDLMDGLRGFFQGIAIGAMLLAVWKNRLRAA